MPVKLLAGFRGYMIADASSVYHELYRNEPGIIEVCCWALYLEFDIIAYSDGSERSFRRDTIADSDAPDRQRGSERSDEGWSGG